MAEEIVYESFNEFNTFDEFLDSQISPLDIYYLEDEELARQLVELGYRGTGEVIKKEEFLARKVAAENLRIAKRSAGPKALASQGIDLSKSPFLQAIADREFSNRDGKLTSILYIRDKNTKGQEVSGYIDLAERFATEDFTLYFSGKKRLIPRSTDLSYYNWKTQSSSAGPTSNFEIIDNVTPGLLFKNKRDRKVINVDPSMSPGDNTIRTSCETTEYEHVVFFDHITRRKT